MFSSAATREEVGRFEIILGLKASPNEDWHWMTHAKRNMHACVREMLGSRFELQDLV